MSPFRGIYCFVYESAKKSGGHYSVRTSGTLILSVILGVSLLAIFFLMIGLLPDFADSMEDLLKATFGRKSGKSIGYLIGLVVIGSIYPVVRFTVGTAQSVEETLSAFKAMEETAQARTVKQAKMLFYGALFLFVLSVMVAGIMTG